MDNLLLFFIERLINNPLELVFALLFGLGWYLKNKTELKNQIIPLVLFGAGALLGFLLLDYGHLNNVLIGLVIAMSEIGAFEGYKALASLNK